VTKSTKANKQPHEPNEAELLSELQSLRKMQAEAATLARETGYISDEQIADRRAEAVKEAEEALDCLWERKRKR
jgi:hypothetical protein